MRFIVPYGGLLMMLARSLITSTDTQRDIQARLNDATLIFDAAKAATTQLQVLHDRPVLRDPREARKRYSAPGTAAADPNILSAHDYKVYTVTEQYPDARAQLFGFHLGMIL